MFSSTVSTTASLPVRILVESGNNDCIKPASCSVFGMGDCPGVSGCEIMRIFGVVRSVLAQHPEFLEGGIPWRTSTSSVGVYEETTLSITVLTGPRSVYIPAAWSGRNTRGPVGHQVTRGRVQPLEEATLVVLGCESDEPDQSKFTPEVARNRTNSAIASRTGSTTAFHSEARIALIAL